jgi:hypothetical protein
MTQREAILKVLKSGDTISSMEAFAEFGITRLSAIIFDLRKRGYDITSVDEKTTNRFGGTVVFSRYKLEEA